MAGSFRTLESLRKSLAARLGFGGDLGAGARMAPIFNEFLADAQRQIYTQFDWPFLIKFDDATVGFEQTLINYPSDCNRTRIISIAVNDNGSWCELMRGIDWGNRDSVNDYDMPARWEAFEQIEVSPMADQLYTLRIKYVKELEAFENDGDRATVDDNLIYLLALANAKAHYRHPDANLAMNEFGRQLQQVKSNSRHKAIHKRRKGSSFDDAYSEPVRDNQRV